MDCLSIIWKNRLLPTGPGNKVYKELTLIRLPEYIPETVSWFLEATRELLSCPTAWNYLQTFLVTWYSLTWISCTTLYTRWKRILLWQKFWTKPISFNWNTTRTHSQWTCLPSISTIHQVFCIVGNWKDSTTNGLLPPATEPYAILTYRQVIIL